MLDDGPIPGLLVNPPPFLLEIDLRAGQGLDPLPPAICR